MWEVLVFLQSCVLESRRRCRLDEHFVYFLTELKLSKLNNVPERNVRTRGGVQTFDKESQIGIKENQHMLARGQRLETHTQCFSLYSLFMEKTRPGGSVCSKKFEV